MLILVLMTAVNCGVSAVAVHRFVDISVMAHWQIPMFVVFLQLQYIDRVIDVCCAAPAVRVQAWRIRSSSHSCNVDAGHVAHTPVVALTGAWDGRDSAVHCGGCAVGTHRPDCFLGLSTQVHGQGSSAIRAGKGWRGRRELAPRRSASRISCIIRTCLE